MKQNPSKYNSRIYFQTEGRNKNTNKIKSVDLLRHKINNKAK